MRLVPIHGESQDHFFRLEGSPYYVVIREPDAIHNERTSQSIPNATFPFPLLSLLGKLDAQDEMLETVAVHLVAGLDGVLPVHEADKGEALGHARLPVLRQEHARNASEALEHVAELALLGHLGNLQS